MLTSNRSDFRPYTRNASVTISNRRVRTRMHGGVAGVGGQPPPLCRSNGILGNWESDNFLMTYREVAMSYCSTYPPYLRTLRGPRQFPALRSHNHFRVLLLFTL